MKKVPSATDLRLYVYLILFGNDDNINTENVFDWILLLAKEICISMQNRKTASEHTDILELFFLYRNKTEEHNDQIRCSC